MKGTVIILALSLFFLCGCQTAQEKITNANDYAGFLSIRSDEKLKKIDTELNFWKNRLKTNPHDLVARSKIASLLSKRFARTGDITEMHQADSIYQLVLPLNRNNSSATYRSLANVCISLHKFRKAQSYLDSATQLGDDKYLTLLMAFDVAMELGNYSQARKILQAFGKNRSFEVLIRQSKFKDHVEGKQDEAIMLMEEAYQKIKGQGDEEIELWTLSNLGDHFTHANRYKEAYHFYLEALRIDPGYYHALQGIGWLAYSKDRDLNNARRIFEYLLNHHLVPDYYLPLAQISAMQGMYKEADDYYTMFVNKSSGVLYGDMYNKYLFLLQCDKLKDYDYAMRIAEREVSIRPTPDSYDLLAWAYFKKGNTKQAVSISKMAVENRCFEPNALYHLGIINLSIDKIKARKYLSQAGESSTELGPMISIEIEKALKSL